MGEKRLAGGAVLGQPGSPAGRGLPDAQLALAEADNAVPETWLRLSRLDTRVIAGPERLRRLDLAVLGN